MLASSRPWRAGMAVAIAAMALGCAEPERAPDPFRYLQLGVEPQDEAPAVARDLQRAGFRIDRRIAGTTFVAIGARDPVGNRTAVRIVTRRGIALALDAPDARNPHLEAVSLPQIPQSGRDIDGEGHEEILVQVRDIRRDRSCIGIVRVRGDGHAVEMVLRLQDIAASPRELCIEDVRNVGGGPSLEALVPVGYDALARDRVPTVVVPFVGGEHYWAPAPAEAYRDYWKRQQRTRRKTLERARDERDVETAYRIAIERAAIARYTGEPKKTQLERFDDTLEGLVLTPGQSEAIDEARRFIGAGWGGDEDGRGAGGEDGGNARGDGGEEGENARKR